MRAEIKSFWYGNLQTTYKREGKQMKKEKKENKKEIVVLDEGIDTDALIGPESVCCGSMLIPYRMY